MSDRGILWEKVYYFSLLLQLIRCLDTCLQFIDSSIRLFFIWIIHLIATYCCLGKKAIPKYPIYVKLKVGILSSRNTIFRIYYIQFGILWYMSHDGNCAIDSWEEGWATEDWGLGRHGHPMKQLLGLRYIWYVSTTDTKLALSVTSL